MRTEYKKSYGNNKYLIAVAVNDLGYRCGYVGVPKGDPLYGMQYDDEIFYAVSVHGGLSFSDTRKFVTPDDIWFFGFDCGHCGDAVDKMTEEGKAHLNREPPSFYNFLLEGHVWTLDEVIAESESMADQLAKLSKNIIQNNK